jgi:prepilin-type N-terminal cleavage/methylation domain-containing protein
MAIARIIRRGLKQQRGFTLVELLIASMISVFLMAGMAGLVEMAMNQINTSRDVTVISDAARRALTSMDRQIKQGLRFDDTLCDTTQVTFWGDVDSDNADSDIDLYPNAEKVRFFMEGNNLRETIKQPDIDPGGHQGESNTVTLCGNVDNLTFLYFTKGKVPIWNQLTQTYDNGIAGSYNDSAGMIKVVVNFRRGTRTRRYEQDIFLRILKRAS